MSRKVYGCFPDEHLKFVWIPGINPALIRFAIW